ETLAGKPGTCTGQGAKLGLFTSFGPVHDPQLAVTVILRNSHTGGKYAAGVAGQVYRNLQARFGPRPGTQPMLANDPLVPRPHIDPRKADEINGEDKDDDDAAATGTDATVLSEAGDDSTRAASQNNAGQPSLQQPALKKTVRTVERPAPAAPSKTTAPTLAPEQKTNGSVERPRRVSDKPE